jgi:diaminopimelate epimerase
MMITTSTPRKGDKCQIKRGIYTTNYGTMYVKNKVVELQVVERHVVENAIPTHCRKTFCKTDKKLACQVGIIIRTVSFLVVSIKNSHLVVQEAQPPPWVPFCRVCPKML